jgi:hypothetical protein
MLVISNRQFKNVVTDEATSFYKGNALTPIEYTFDFDVAFKFTADVNDQVIISATNTLTLLNGKTWGDYGFLIGNEIDIDGTILPFDPSDPTITINETVNILDIQGNVLIHDGSISNIGQIFAGQNNTFFEVTNNDITEPEVIDLFFNLVPNSQNGSIFSLIDGEVNRIRTNVAGMSTSDVRTGVQLGNKSGGGGFTLEITKETVGYSAKLLFSNFLYFDGNIFTRPDEFLASESIKPFVRLEAFAEENNPNGVIKYDDFFQNGNVGWFNENYNQGVNPFSVSVVIKDSNGDVINDLDHTQTNSLEVTVTSANDFEEEFLVAIGHLPQNDNDWKNNQFNFAQNTFACGIAKDFLGGTNFIALGKFGAQWSVANITSTTATSGEIFITFDLIPNADFTAYFDARPSDRAYLIGVEVRNEDEDNLVSLLAQVGNMEKAPLVGGEADEFEGLRFYEHNSDGTGSGLSAISEGRIHDDILVKGLGLFSKSFVYESARLLVQVRRVADNARFNLQSVFINLSAFPSFNGLQFIDYFEQLNTTLPNPDRNFVRFKQVNDLGATYNVELEHTILIDWSFWVQNNQAFAEFLANRNQKYSNYQTTGYEIYYRLELVKNGVTFFREALLSAFDYDEPQAITTIALERLDGTPINVLPPNETIKVIATHTLPTGTWGSNAWGYLQFQKFGTPNWAIISTEWNHTTNNAPFQPLPSETKATKTINGDEVVVEALINTSGLEEKYNITARVKGSNQDVAEDTIVLKIEIIGGIIEIDFIFNPINDKYEEVGDTTYILFNETLGVWEIYGDIGVSTDVLAGSTANDNIFSNWTLTQDAIDAGFVDFTTLANGSNVNNVFTAEFKKIDFPEEFEGENRKTTTCKEPFLTLADLNDGIEWKNDFRSIAFIADSLDAILIKNGVELPALGVALSFPFQPDAVGFTVNWREVLANYGTGCYQLVGKYDIGGFEYVANYGTHDLKHYSKEISERTIRVGSQYDDFVKMKGINFKDSGYFNTIRVSGFFGNYQPNTTATNLLKKRDIYAKVRNIGKENYELITDPLNSCHTCLLQEMLIAGNDLKVSDFNADNHKEYKNVSVVLSEDSAIEYIGDNVPLRQIRVDLTAKEWLIESRYSENQAVPRPYFEIYNFGVIGDLVNIEINGNVEGQVSGGLTAEINITNQDNNPATINSVGVVGNVFNVEINEPRILNNYYDVESGTVSIPLRAVKATEAGAITSVNAGGLTSLVIELNGNPVTAPFTLATGDSLEFTFDAAVTDTEITLTGTYV